MACRDSNENEELRDCTPECVKYFTDFGGDCELLEDAAKLQVVRAFNMGKLTSDETKALFAWYVLSSTDVCPHAPTLSLYRSIALSLTRSLRYDYFYAAKEFNGGYWRRTPRGRAP